jgi:tonB family protein|nr:MAG TPA: hypothetical protein [Caudoviricetes sp.]
MEINITLDIQGATVEEVQWLAGLLAAQRTAPAPITVEKAAPAAPVEAEDKPKKAAKKPAAKKTAKKADPAPEPEPTPEPEPVADETDGATLDDADAPNEDALKAQAIERATALLATEGGAEAVKAALDTVGARRVSALTGDDVRAFLDALPEA